MSSWETGPSRRRTSRPTSTGPSTRSGRRWPPPLRHLARITARARATGTPRTDGANALDAPRLRGRVLGGLAQPPGHDLEELEPDRGVFLDQAPEHPRGQPQQPDGRGRGHRGRPRPAVEEGDLAEEVPGSELRPGLPPNAHPRGPLGDQEEPDSAVPLKRDDVPLGVLDLLGRAADRLELALRAAGEHGNLRELLGHLSGIHATSSTLADSSRAPTRGNPGTTAGF